MKKRLRRLYVAPSVEIIPMAAGCVMAASDNPGGSLGDFGPGDNLFPTSARTSAGRNDLESMINDILTVGQ